MHNLLLLSATVLIFAIVVLNMKQLALLWWVLVHWLTTVIRATVKSFVSEGVCHRRMLVLLELLYADAWQGSLL